MYLIFFKLDAISLFEGEKSLNDIGILVFLIIMWNCISINKSDNMVLIVVILTIVYCVYIVAQKCPDGTTESLLL